MHVAELAVVLQWNSHSIKWVTLAAAGAFFSQYHCDGYLLPFRPWYNVARHY